jgi:hypothetical protein
VVDLWWGSSTVVGVSVVSDRVRYLMALWWGYSTVIGVSVVSDRLNVTWWLYGGVHLK